MQFLLSESKKNQNQNDIDEDKGFAAKTLKV